MKVVKNEKTAEIVGLCFGDGSLTIRHSGIKKGKLRFQMRGHIIEDRAHYDNYVKPLFEETIGKISITIYNGKKPYYGIASENQKFCEHLVSLGVHIGIKSIVKNPLLRKEKNWKTLHILRIESSQDVEKWFNIIGSNNPKHITKFIVWKKFGFCPPHTNIEQRRKMLNKEINPALFYNKKEYAEVAEPGQMRKVEDVNQKPCPLVGARVQITSSALH